MTKNISSSFEIKDRHDLLSCNSPLPLTKIFFLSILFYFILFFLFFIFYRDSRPKTNARANRLGGGGYESKRAYKCVTTEFQDIENIHVVRNSLLSLRSGYSANSPSEV